MDQTKKAAHEAAKNEYHELVRKIESCVLESGLPFKKTIDALDAVRESYRCKGINFLNKVNIQEVQEENTTLI